MFYKFKLKPQIIFKINVPTLILKGWQFASLQKINSRLKENTTFLEPLD